MMAQYLITDLAECSEFRQTIAARPPKIVHGTVMLLSMLTLCAVGWAAWTRVHLVVLAQGRIRPSDIPLRIFTPIGIENAGRVVFAPFDEGDCVKKGQVLLRLDTSRIDLLIDKTTRSIERCDLELTNLTSQQELLNAQMQAATEKANVELRMAQATVDRHRLRRDSEIRSAQAEQRAAEQQLHRLKQLQHNQVSSKQELEEAETRLRSACEKLVQVQLPVDEAAINLAQQSIQVVHRDFAVRYAELESRIVVKQSEKETLTKDLSSLRLQHDEAVLLAPLDGIIVSGRVRVGDMLEAGKPVYELAQQGDNCFEAVVSADDIGELTVGLPVRIRMDAYDYTRYGTLNGTVCFIAPDSKPIDASASTTYRPEANSRAATFTMRVELETEQASGQPRPIPAKLGLTGTAEIVTSQESLLNVLLKQIRRTISFL